MRLFLPHSRKMIDISVLYGTLPLDESLSMRQHGVRPYTMLGL